MRPVWEPQPPLNDGMFNLEHDIVPWPGYINNHEHPLGFNNVGFMDNKWCGTDDEKSFQKNKLKMPKDWHYHTKEISYQWNKSGYRTYEWTDINWSEAIVLLGDSCTFGVGLAKEETIAYMLETLTGRQVVNLGIPGGSNNAIVALAAELKEKFGTPYAVVINWSTTDRLRFYHSTGYREVGPWDSEDFVIDRYTESVDISKLWELNVINEYHEMCSSYYLGKVAKAMWADVTKYISISFFPHSAHFMRAEKHFPFNSEARDLIHPGVNSSFEVSTYIYNRLSE